MNGIKVFGIVAAVIGVIFFLSASSRLVESVDAGETVICQDPIDGDLHYYNTPGLVSQNFGTCTHYRRSVQIWFTTEDVAGVDDESAPVKIRFNDGGHADIHGSVRADFPTDTSAFTKLYATYGSQHNAVVQLIQQVVRKSIYLTGPLMSSKESYAERRNDLINYIEDQAQHGVYKTQSRDIKTRDPLSGEEKTVTITEIVKTANGEFARQENSPLSEFGVRVYNFSPTSVDYEERVEQQIQTQQNAIMQVQTAMANAKRAEQEAITTEQQGRADAAKSKWEQEAINAKEIAEAEKQLQVARLSAQQAEQYKREQILRGEGEAAYKRLVMQADGALEQKLEAWKHAQTVWADAFAKRQGNVVPEVVFGGNGAGVSTNANQMMMEMLAIKAARELSLDLRTKP